MSDDLGAAYADLESEIRIAVSLHCTGPGVPCELCLRETGRAMKAIDAYARDVARHERTREQPAPGRQARQLDAALQGLAQIHNHVHDDLPDWVDVQLAVDDVIAEINELADGAAPAEPQPAPDFRALIRDNLIPEPAPELAAAMAETRNLRELLGEILRTFGDSSGDGWRARVGQVKYRQWRERAGLPK